VSGEELRSSIVHNSASVFFFDVEYQLNQEAVLWKYIYVYIN